MLGAHRNQKYNSGINKEEKTCNAFSSVANKVPEKIVTQDENFFFLTESTISDYRRRNLIPMSMDLGCLFGLYFQF